jgi:hypothetical protein
LNGFSVIEPGIASHAGEELASRWQSRPAPKVVSSAGTFRPEAEEEALRVQARMAVRAYSGTDDFVRKVRRDHEGDRYWLPNRRTAEALLNIIAGTSSPRFAVT